MFNIRSYLYVAALGKMHVCMIGAMGFFVSKSASWRFGPEPMAGVLSLSW